MKQTEDEDEWPFESTSDALSLEDIRAWLKDEPVPIEGEILR